MLPTTRGLRHKVYVELFGLETSIDQPIQISGLRKTTLKSFSHRQRAHIVVQAQSKMDAPTMFLPIRTIFARRTEDFRMAPHTSRILISFSKHHTRRKILHICRQRGRIMVQARSTMEAPTVLSTRTISATRSRIFQTAPQGLKTPTRPLS